MTGEPEVIATNRTGRQLLADPYLNKGSAFPPDERDALGLRGLTPVHVSTIEQQLARTYENFRTRTSALDKFVFLAALHDRNEILFFRLLREHIAEMAPIIYTPTVGEACQRYSHIFRRARGMYLSSADADDLPCILRESAPDNIAVIVVTDGERILGLGDLGVGGMGIPIGKLCLYTLCAGIDPRRTLPVVLDVGTNNKTLLSDPLYLGAHHPRLERTAYDRFIQQFVDAVHQRWPQAILQWEDFAKDNAWRLLKLHQNRLPSFNDDIQGTAAVAVAGLLRASKIQNVALKDQRVVIVGAGSAATGIGALFIKALCEDGLSDEKARESVWLVDTQGLVHQGRNDLSEEKALFAQSVQRLRHLGLNENQPLLLQTVVSAVKPTALLGTSGQSGMFTEELIRTMAASLERPIIFPLSNPTSKSEANPEDVVRWTAGRALIATGSPYPPVEWQGGKIPIGQCNNSFVFPGVGLGLVASAAKLVPEEVFLAAARTLAAFDERLPGFEASLFPNLEHVRDVSYRIALAVAKEIVVRGLSANGLALNEIPRRVSETMWEPVYPKLRKA